MSPIPGIVRLSPSAESDTQSSDSGVTDTHPEGIWSLILKVARLLKIDVLLFNYANRYKGTYAKYRHKEGFMHFKSLFS